MDKGEALRRFASRPASYIYCRICGHEPKTERDEPNRGPLRFWEPDDGWVIGTLCRWCWMEVCNDQPKPEDYAYEDQDTIHIDNTDEDPTIALLGEW